ncbi:MAG: Uma2 family endonuclease [Dehalococcoidia bacterium]
MAIRRPAHRRPADHGDDWSRFHGIAMTEEAFLRLDEAEETDLEYIDGIVYEKGMVDANHGDIVGELSGRFWIYRNVAGGALGPERRVRLANGRYLKPDLAFYAVGSRSANDALPTLAIEVRSPGETMESQRRKCRRYRAAGVPVVWLVDPRGRVVEVFEGDRDGVALEPDAPLETPLLPGLSIAHRELFAVLDRDRG